MSLVHAEAVSTPRSPWELVRLYAEIARPRVIALVVFTGLPALWLGKDVWPTASQALWVLVGTAAAGVASSAFNAWIERESDARMARTRDRPLPASSILPGAVLGYGVAATVVSAGVLYGVGGWMPVAVAMATIAFYVVAYTWYLKPRTPQNIVIGGAAGGTAPLIASAAVDGSISVGAWILFAIIFLWTPPHFWGVAIVRQNEYAAAGLPMMPHAVGEQGTRWRSLGYTLALLPVTLLPVWLGFLGPLYASVALASGLWFLYLVIRSLIDKVHPSDWRVFKGSIGYLTLLFLVMLVDLTLPWGTT